MATYTVSEILEVPDITKRAAVVTKFIHLANVQNLISNFAHPFLGINELQQLTNGKSYSQWPSQRSNLPPQKNF